MMGKSFPKISIITPSFNQGVFIEETIVSVVGQGYPNLEYIIIDGGSTDSTVDIIKKYSDKISYWISEKDRGQSHAINKGFALATGDIIGWLNSDDAYRHNALFCMAETANTAKQEVYFGNCIHFKQTQQSVEAWGSNVVLHAASGKLENYDYIIQPSSFWSRRAWELAGPLREDIHYAFDWEWFLRAKQAGVIFHSLAHCLSMYRIHEGHKSGSGGDKRQQEILAIYSQYAPQYTKLYDLIRREDFSCTSLESRLTRKFLFLSGKPYSNVDIVKYLNKNKYSAYSSEEMNNCLLML